MSGGYAGKIINVDLTRSKVEIRELDMADARKYIGGVGLAARIIWESTNAETEPFSPENPLIFMAGPLTGTSAPSNSRFSVAAISPLTGIWGEAHSGGSWAYQLKHAGFDGVVFEGRSEKPVYLWVHDGAAELRDAGHVWGKLVYESSDTLQKETDARASVATIGPAGEKLVRIAGIITEGRIGRAAARCGLGAVMGDKNLKAVVVRGTQGLNVHSRAELKESVNSWYQVHETKAIEIKDEEAKKAHERAFVERYWQRGMASIKNFLEGEFLEFPYKYSDAKHTGVNYFCPACRFSSSECCLIEGRRRNLAESMVPIGARCLIHDMDALQEALDLCQEYGIDAISAGGVLAFAIEAFENGLLTEDDTEGIKLAWGDAEAMLRMLHKIVRREGFGWWLGEGSKRAAEHLGGKAPEYAIHVKGLEIPAHDPRSSNSLALEYATASRGADHLSGFMAIFPYFSPELGRNPESDLLENRFKVEGKAEEVANSQDYMCLLDSLVICKQLLWHGLQPSELLNWLNLTTGLNMDIREFLKCGERIFNLKRLINVRRGVSSKDDLLHPRLMTHPRGGTSDAAVNLPPVGEMLSRYYAYRGWTAEGIPSDEKLAELGLPQLPKVRAARSA
ncbi:MAG: aldehyde ferredoxin oxidoreductase family protein [Chloroflexota bacterium]